MNHVVPAEEMPLVSVVVPCYNYGRFLTASVGSVLAQSDANVEVIVVDDASPDGSVDEANRLATRDRRVRVIAHAKNQGHIATYNEGLRAANGDYLVLLSADDALAPGSLARAVEVMEAHPGIGFTYGPAATFTDVAPPVVNRLVRNRLWDGRSWLRRRCTRATNCIFSPEVVLRRSIYERIGPYRSDMPLTGDLAMWVRAAAVADIAYIAGPPAAYYRMHGANMHTQLHGSGRVEGMLFDLEQRRAAFDSITDMSTRRHAELCDLRDVAMHKLAAEAFAAAARGFAWGLAESWPINELVGFGFDTYENAADLPEWRRLRYRMRLGSARASTHLGIRVKEKVLGLGRALGNWHETFFHA